jgi:hypothetical protein
MGHWFPWSDKPEDPEFNPQHHEERKKEKKPELVLNFRINLHMGRQTPQMTNMIYLRIKVQDCHYMIWKHFCSFVWSYNNQDSVLFAKEDK